MILNNLLVILDEEIKNQHGHEVCMWPEKKCKCGFSTDSCNCKVLTVLNSLKDKMIQLIIPVIK
jgi:hypothetical protein